MTGTDKVQEFEEERRRRIAANGENHELVAAAADFMRASTRSQYSYNFSWLGRPIIQYPQDIVAMQEIIWSVQPDLIIETGVAHGGSIIFYASMLELLGSDGRVLGIDIDIRKHNRVEIERHPMSKRITLIEGSSVDPLTVERVMSHAQGRSVVMVVLDSNHTHQHVLAELRSYSTMVTPGSYCVVFDTIIEEVPEGTYVNRPWNRKDNPATAVREFLSSTAEFEVDHETDKKLMISVARGGFLRRKASA